MGDRGKVQSIQILRFLAAASVVWLHNYHAAGEILYGHSTVGPVGSLSAIGVDIFFVISGAIIYLTAFSGASRPSPAAFMRRRLIRIVPIYFLLSALWWPVMGYFGERFSWREPATTFLFWPAWDLMTFPLIGVGWSLCFEMLFYLGAAICLSSRRAIWLIGLLFVACWAARGEGGQNAYRFLGNPIILEFFFGVFIMWAWQRRRADLSAWFGLGLLVIAVGALIWLAPPLKMADASFVVTGDLSLLRVIIWGIPAAMIFTAFLTFERVAVGRIADRLVFLGEASYAIYLAHYPIRLALAHVLRGWHLGLPFWPLAIGLSLLGIGAGVAVHVWLERPLISWLKRRAINLAPQAA